MTKRKSGFTLMEIMVVIIVIAVLASVAGPMIGSITDQGRASATKSKLSNLKSALLAYQADVGRLPVKGPITCAASYDQDTVLSENEDKNYLSSNVDPAYASSNEAKKNYQRKWKGPYMDSDPSDFMVDSWGNTIRYVAKGGSKNVYLQSAGPDGDFESNVDKAFKSMSDEDSGIDDIVIQITKLRKNLDGTGKWDTATSNGS